MGGLLVGLGDTLTWIQCCCYCLSCYGIWYDVTYAECYVDTLLYLLDLQMLLFKCWYCNWWLFIGLLCCGAPLAVPQKGKVSTRVAVH